MTVGIQLALRSIFMLVLHVFLFILIFRARINREEEVLQTKFGEKYSQYKTKTYRMFP